MHKTRTRNYNNCVVGCERNRYYYIFLRKYVQHHFIGDIAPGNDGLGKESMEESTLNTSIPNKYL